MWSRAEAKKQGLRFYYKKCLVHPEKSKRYTKTGYCVECYRMYRVGEIDHKDISKDPYKKGELKTIRMGLCLNKSHGKTF